jgi:hypothetical protein
MFRVKYPLVVISKLLNAFSNDLGGGYDIRCRFKTILSCSVLRNLTIPHLLVHSTDTTTNVCVNLTISLHMWTALG